MRFLILALLFLIPPFTFCQSNDAALNQRLSDYLAANNRLDYETIMSYIHPKLFQVATKESMIAALKQAFNNDQIAMHLDSMQVESVSPVFSHNTSAYRKVGYVMTMDMTFKDSSRLKDPNFVATMKTSLAKTFKGTAAYEPVTKTFHLRGRQFMIAVKDKGQPWMFIGHKADRSLNEFLFPQAVIAKFRLLQE